MAFIFNEVLITCFDIHPTILPFSAESPESYFQERFKFLASSEKYNEKYISLKEDKTESTNSLKIRRLSIKERKTKFWEPYIFENENLAWEYHLPMKCFLKEELIKPNLQNKEFESEFEIFIYLSPIGWSTNLGIRIRGNPISNSDLIDFVGEIRAGNEIFLVENNPASLTDVYKYIQKILLNEIYEQNKKPFLGANIKRHLVISINKSAAKPIEYENFQDADWGLMREILFGRRINVLNLAQENQKYRLTKTEISSPFNFALTDFDVGTLIFLQKDAIIPKKERAVYCLAHNIRDCFSMTFTMLEFYKENARKNTELFDDTKKLTRDNLIGIRNVYKNQLCQNIFGIDEGLKKIINANQL